MGHVPVVYLSRPWDGAVLSLDPEADRHLTTVLRLAPGDPVEYTDGEGTFGRGEFSTDGVARGTEHDVQRPEPLTVLAAPPKARDRQRFLVEKLVEVGVTGMGWLRTRHTQGRPVRPQKAHAWMVSALEQSRQAWLPDYVESVPIDEIDATNATVVAADREGSATLPGPRPQVLLVGPEAGWADGELSSSIRRLALAPGVLRTETAAVVGAALLRYR